MNWLIIGSGNGLSPGRHQAIAWTNAGLLSTGPLGTKFSEILIKIHTFSVNKQSGTKPNLIAKILATNFGVFFVI